MITKDSIYLPHAVMDCWWYREEIPCCVYFYLLFNASYCDCVQYGIPVKNGQVVTSYSAIARSWHYKEDEIKKAVKQLRKSGDILDIKKVGHYLLFTINQHDEMMRESLDKHFGRNVANRRASHKEVKKKRIIANTSEYSNLLKDPRWQKKRLEILQRDGFKCTNCGDDSHTLHVHHLYYTKGLKPWEYPDDALVTLCERCHNDKHKKDAHD